MIPDYQFDHGPTVGANCCEFVKNHNNKNMMCGANKPSSQIK